MCVGVGVRASVCICLCLCVCVCVRVCVCVCECMYACVCTGEYICVCVCLSRYILYVSFSLFSPSFISFSSICVLAFNAYLLFISQNRKVHINTVAEMFLILPPDMYLFIV